MGVHPFFEGSVGVRRAGLSFDMNEDEMNEYIKCKLDINYFIQKYCYTKSQDGTQKIIKLRDYQHEILDNFSNHRFNILMASRQSGKTITAGLTILHYII